MKPRRRTRHRMKARELRFRIQLWLVLQAIGAFVVLMAMFGGEW